MLGISGYILKWLHNYLSNRRQRTLANNKLSEACEVVCGVPQGSILGPLLFLIYINDISSVVNNSLLHLYADDTVIYISGSDLNFITSALQQDLNKIVAWCEESKLTINVKKTKYVIFGLKSQTKKIGDHHMTVNATKLDKVNSYKYLGITLDSNLTFNKHIENCKKFATHKVFLLSKIRKYINMETSLKIFKSMVIPYIEYGDIIYSGSNSRMLGKLQNIQNRGLRVCLNEARISTVSLHQRCKLATLKVRRLAHLRNYMFKKQRDPRVIDARPFPTRAYEATIFKIIRTRNEKYKKSPLYRGAIEWNSLSVATRRIGSYEAFKRYQKNWMLSTNYVQIQSV